VASLDDAYDMERFLGEFFDLLGDVTLGAHAKDIRIVDQLLVHFEETDIGSGPLVHVVFLRGMQRVCSEGHVLIEHPTFVEIDSSTHHTLGRRQSVTGNQP